MNKTERIRKVIADFPLNEFSVGNIYKDVKDYDCSLNYVRSIITRLVNREEIYRIKRIGKASRAITLYSKKRPQPFELPSEFSLEKAGEMIFAYTQLLKQQIYTLEEKLERTHEETNYWRKRCQAFQKALNSKTKELKETKEAFRNKVSKTFPIHEVAQVIRNGKLSQNS